MTLEEATAICHNITAANAAEQAKAEREVQASLERLIAACDKSQQIINEILKTL
jgi:hypothetical protein